MKHETVKILEENTGSNLFDISLSNFLLYMAPEACETEAKMNNWDTELLHSEGNSQQY